MTNKTLYNISTQQIQIFLKSVELKNFTQVANYFSFTPSMVSKTISALEEELELELFIRKPHDLTPTPAAYYLAREWRQTMASISNSIRKAHYYNDGETATIVLGFVDSSEKIDKLIMNGVREYSARHSNVKIIIEKHDMHRAAELLNNGLLDIIITSDFEADYLDEHELPWEKLVTTSVVAFVPGSNPLFNKEAITFEDLKGENLMGLNPSMHPSYRKFLENLCEKHGFSPNVVSTYRTVRSLMFSLQLYKYIFIGDSINSDWVNEDLKMFRLPESSFSLIAWRKENCTDEILAFKDFLKNMYPAEI